MDLLGMCSRPRYGVDGSISLGATPRRGLSATSPRVPTLHPFGISFNSDFTNEAGNRLATCLGTLGARPSALARTGSKFTNQLAKIARAIVSKVWIIRLLSSIFSSNAQRMHARARCCTGGGKRNGTASIIEVLRFGIVAPTA